MSRWRTPIGAAALAAALLLATGCSGDDGAADDTSVDAGTGTSEDATDVDGDLGELVIDADLVVPRDYLQGEWCDSDGQSWVIEGDNARWKDATGGSAEVPAGIVFGDGEGIELRSQTDDAFTFGRGGDEVTFTRGNC